MELVGYSGICREMGKRGHKLEGVRGGGRGKPFRVYGNLSDRGAWRVSEWKFGCGWLLPENV